MELAKGRRSERFATGNGFACSEFGRMVVDTEHHHVDVVDISLDGEQSNSSHLLITSTALVNAAS
jgi:hypothetical protein